MDKKIVKDFADLYSLKLGTVAELERMAEKSAQNLLDEIAASKKSSLDRLINGAGAAHGGRADGGIAGRAFWID